MSFDREKAFEVSSNGFLVEDGAWHSSGTGVPTHSANVGDWYFRTAANEHYKNTSAISPGTTWTLVQKDQLKFIKEANSNTSSSTTSLTYVNKTTLTETLLNKDYLVKWAIRAGTTGAGGATYSSPEWRFRLNSTTDLVERLMGGKKLVALEHAPYSGWAKFKASAGSNSIASEFKRGIGTTIAHVDCVAMSIWEIM